MTLSNKGNDQRPLRVDYESHGRNYAQHRRADPRIAARILAALGDARTVVNVGAGTGSYEPSDRTVFAVEPSAVMRAQRTRDMAPVIAARAEALPFADDAVDGAMACLTTHHWRDRARGLSEMRRVTRGPVVVFTFDLERLPDWQQEYLGEVIRVEQSRFGRPDEIAAELGGRSRIEAVPTHFDCNDGFIQAFWRRPAALLDAKVRGAQSVWTLLEPGVEDRIVERLADALGSGEWDERHGHLRDQDICEGGLRLIISDPTEAN